MRKYSRLDNIHSPLHSFVGAVFSLVQLRRTGTQLHRSELGRWRIKC